MAPVDYEEYLVYQYGDDWRTPSQRFKFGLSNAQRFKQLAIMYIKELIPTPILERLQEKKEQHVLDFFIDKIQKKQNVFHEASL